MLEVAFPFLSYINFWDSFALCRNKSL